MKTVLESLEYSPEENAFVLSGRGDCSEGELGQVNIPVLMRYIGEKKNTKESLLISRLPENDAAQNAAFFELKIPLDAELLPLVAISVDLPEYLSLTDSISSFLKGIFPRDKKEYESKFISQVQRFKSESVQFFVARQISRHYSGLRAYRVAGAVVMAYKAIELKDPVLQKEAMAQVVEHLENIDECETDWHPRRNGQHLATSLLLVKWHLELAMNRLEDFVATLEACRDYAKSDLVSYFTPAYNLSLSLLMLCVITRLDKTAEAAQEIANEGFVLFKKAVEDSEFKKSLFMELGVSNRAISYCLLASEPKAPTKPDCERWVRHALRVKGTYADELVANVLVPRLKEGQS